MRARVARHLHVDPFAVRALPMVKMPPLDLAKLSMRAEEDSAARWLEHHDASGQVPADIDLRARRLSRLSDLCQYLARGSG